MDKATPGPWVACTWDPMEIPHVRPEKIEGKICSGKFDVARCPRKEDAEFIVEAVNTSAQKDAVIKIYEEALTKIANEDYRGNRPQSAVTAYVALQSAKSLREKVPEENKKWGCNHAGPICDA